MGKGLTQQRDTVRQRPAAVPVCLSFFLSLILCLLPVNALGVVDDKLETLIFSPKLNNPFYQSIFNDIIRGIEDAAEGEVHTVRLEKSSSPFDSKSWVAEYQPDFIISLGSLSAHPRDKIDSHIPWLLSAVHRAPSHNARHPDMTVSLVPDPELLFQKTIKLLPDTRHIHVVYHRSDQALIDDATEDAKTLGLILESYRADDLKHSAKLHQRLLKQLNSTSDVLWLLQNPLIVDNRLILPRVLKKAWSRRLRVISNNFMHVKHGALISLYPDNYLLGQYLWRRTRSLSEEMHATVTEYTSKDHMEWLQQAKVAVNTRTANHLGLHLNAMQKRQIDLTFPRQ